VTPWAKFGSSLLSILLLPFALLLFLILWLGRPDDHPA
jgi:hypothetical protein